MDGERACQEGVRLVFAVDQRPFGRQKAPSGRVNRFCVLHPLMTLEGERVAPSPASFPSRGRISSLLPDAIRQDLVVPGAIWTGTIENAVKRDPQRSDTDHYQVNVRDIHQGDPELVEILQVPEEHPDVAWVQREKKGMPWPRPATQTVVLF